MTLGTETTPKPGSTERTKAPALPAGYRPPKKGRPRKLLSPEELGAEEDRLKAKYGHIKTGTLLNATKGLVTKAFSDEEVHKYRHKRSCIIECTTNDCHIQRRIATSDLAQVSLCEECTRLARNERKRERRRAARAAK